MFQKANLLYNEAEINPSKKIKDPKNKRVKPRVEELKKGKKTVKKYLFGKKFAI